MVTITEGLHVECTVHTKFLMISVTQGQDFLFETLPFYRWGLPPCNAVALALSYNNKHNIRMIVFRY